MGKLIQTMADHWQKLFACVLFVLIAQVESQGDDVVPFTLVDGAVQKGAVCIDGTPAGYFYAPGFGDGVKNWLIFLEGGGWCGQYLCRRNVGQYLGSTTNVTAMYFRGILSSDQALNPDFYNWNKAYLHYCDGSSFLGDTKTVDQGTTLQLRGSRIFNAVMNELLAKGMENANNAILTGSSAGGLATILHCDGFRALLPNARRVKCLSDGGFFIRAKDLPGAVNIREGIFAHVVAFHNLTNFLPTSCKSRMNASLCLFPENLVGDIQTPLFLLNSAFDRYQVSSNMEPYPDKPSWDNCTNNLNNCTAAQLQLIKDFRNTFLQTLKGIGDNPSRGLFINSCYNHGFMDFNAMWNAKGSPKLKKKTISKAIGDWYFDRKSVRLIDTKNDIPLKCPRS